VGINISKQSFINKFLPFEYINLTFNAKIVHVIIIMVFLVLKVDNDLGVTKID
jgi:hypothetical protein